MTVAVLIVSTLVVIVGTLAVVAWQALFQGGVRKAADRRRASRRKGNGQAGPAEKKQRRIMTFALPVALATWAVVFWFTVKPHLQGDDFGPRSTSKTSGTSQSTAAR